MNTIRMLTPSEIDVRINAVYDDHVSLLLYKTSRVDMAILDETFGPMNWQKRHVKYDDIVFCEISIKNPDTGEWVTKMDGGAPSKNEPIKGAISDSTKRCGFCWSIGRELYSAPYLRVPIEKVNVYQDRDKKKVKDRFKVQSIEYDEEKRIITGLVIVNQKQEVVYQYFKTENPKTVKKGRRITSDQANQLMCELNRTGTMVGAVLKKYQLEKLNDMDYDLWVKAMTTMKTIPDMAA